MTSADSSNSEFDELLLAIGSEIAGERTEPVSLDVVDKELQKRIVHARECLLLLGMTRDYPANGIASDPSDFLYDTAGTGIRAPSPFQRFQLIQSLGTGGFAEVFLAEDPLLHRRVAIKIPHARWVVDPQARQRFLREARVLGQLRHDAIVSVYESGDHNGTPFLVMEHCDAGNLDQHLVSQPQRQDPRVCAFVVHQIAEGLGLAHKLGILHRDIKPRNVLLTRITREAKPVDGSNTDSSSTPPEWKHIQAKLSDFGLAKWLDEEFDAHKTQTGLVAGTLQYMAPEQAAGKTERLSPATDVHGLGVTLYEMLTGQPPFAGDTPVETSWNILNREPIAVRTLRPAVPRDLETICHKALEKDPGRRYPSAVEMAEDLKRFLEDRAILAKPVSLPERVLRSCRHHPELAALMLVICFSVTLISAGGWWYSSRLSAIVASETKLRESESRLLDDSEKRELVLLEQKEQLTAAVQREQLMTYASRMRQAQDLFDHGEIVDYASLLSAMRPRSPQETDFRDFAWRLMNAKCGGEIRPFEDTHNNDFTSVNVIPEKGRIVAGTSTGVFHAWDLQSGAYLGPGLPPLGDRVRICGVAYQPQHDAWFFAHYPKVEQQSGASSKLKYLRTSDGIAKTVAESQRWFERMSRSPDQSKFILDVAREDSRQFQVYSVATGEHLWTVQAGQPGLNQLPGWGPDGTLAVPMLSQIALYDSDGGPVAKLTRDSKDALQEFQSVAISSDGSLLAGLRTDLSVDLWRRSPGENFVFDSTIRVPEVAYGETKRSPGQWYDIQFLNSDMWLAFSGIGNRVYLWNLKAKRLDSRSPVFQSPIASITPLPDDTLMLHESNSGLYRWNPSADGPVLAGHAREAWTVDYTSDGRFLASGSDDGTMKIWEVATGRELATSVNHTQTVVQTVYSPSGTQLASLCLDGSLRVWEINSETGLPVGEHRQADDHRKGRSLSWSSDGRQIATGGYDGEVLLWDADTLQVSRRLQDHDSTVRQILFLDGDQTLLTVSENATVCIRNLSEKDHVIHKWEEEFGVHCIALLPDGATLAVGQSRGVITLRSRSTGKLIGTLTGHRQSVWSMALSPDGKVLATGDEGGWVRFWRTENHQPLLSLRIGDHKVNGLAFSPQGDALAIATHDGKVTLWRAPFVQDIHPSSAEPSLARNDLGKPLDGVGIKKANQNRPRDLALYASTTALDYSFGSAAAGKFTTSFGNGHEEARSVLIQSDGRIIIGGDAQNNSNHDFALARYNVDGTLDSTFGVGGMTRTPIGSDTDILYDMSFQSDGKIVAVGYRDAGGSSDTVVVRYNANGTLDSTFGYGGKIVTASSSKNDSAFAVAVQSDGKIVVVGFAVGSSNNDFSVLRYHTNGTLDTTFDGDGMVITPMSSGSDVPSGVAFQADGKIVVAGYSQNGSNYDFAVARYNTNGSLDPTFDGDGKVTTTMGSSNNFAFSLAIQGDGKIVVGGEASDGRGADFALARYNTDGSLDTTFDHDGQIILAIGTRNDMGRTVVVGDDGKILVAGTAEFGENSDFAVVRFNANGSLDSTFDGDGKMTQAIGAANDYAYDIAVGSEGEIVVVGSSDVSGNTDFAVAKFDTHGSLESGFDHDGPGRLHTNISGNDESKQVIQVDGKLVVVGSSLNGSNSDFAVIRYNADGSLDTTFDGDGKLTTAFGETTDTANCLAVQSDGKIVVAGYTANSGSCDFALARYNADGSLDTTFDGDGEVTTIIGPGEDIASSVAIQADGKIVLAGHSGKDRDYDFALVRYHTNGSLDTSFGNEGILTTSFGSGADLAKSVVIQSDGKILVAGDAINGSNSDFALIRYNTNGSLDTTFDGDGKLTTAIGLGNDVASSVALQSDGKIVVAGLLDNINNYVFALARYHSNGALDTTFDGDGTVTTAIGLSVDFASSVALQADGKIVVAGHSNNGNNTDFAISRYNTNGSLDTTFDGDGKMTTDFGTWSDYAKSVIVQSDGKITVAGYSKLGSSYSNIALARYDFTGESLSLVSPHAFHIEIDRSGMGSGQLIQRPNNSSDGLNRLQVAGIDFAPLPEELGTTDDANQTFITSTINLFGLDTHREVTVPATGDHDIARTVEVFTNNTANTITTTVRIIGNLGSDAATSVFATSDGDSSAETSDRWIGTDDTDGTGTPAIIHYIHGSAGLRPMDVQVVEDSIYWTYLLTVPPAATVRLGHLTVQANSRTDAIAAANTLISPTAFGGQSAAYLTPSEVDSLVNLQFNQAPTDIALSGNSITENSASGAVVGTLTASDPNAEWEQFTYTLVDNAMGRFVILGDQLIVADGSRLDFEKNNSHQLIARVTDSDGLTYDETFTISLTNVDESPMNAP